MTFAGRLVHRLAIVSSASGNPDDIDDLDGYGHALDGADSVVPVRGLVQPRRAKEVEAVSEAGVEVSDHIVYLLPRRVPLDAWIVDADEDGAILEGGRRFDIVGVRSFEFGRTPHLEVDVRLVGSTEGAAVGS